MSLATELQGVFTGFKTAVEHMLTHTQDLLDMTQDMLTPEDTLILGGIQNDMTVLSGFVEEMVEKLHVRLNPPEPPPA